jgi:uncharacterized protein (TIGR00369 family)
MSLSRTLPGTWRLESRVDVTASGERRIDPSLGEDPIALLIYDGSGNFAAQFMKRDRTAPTADLPAAGANNTRAQGGYDAYFGTYEVDDATGTVTQRIMGALTDANVGQVLSRVMTVEGDRLVIQVATTSGQGEPVTRTLEWTRIDRPTRFIRHVGVVIAEQKPGFSECTLEVGRQHDNSGGVAHGGALFTLADTGMGAALIPDLKEGERCATIEVKINYLRPVKAGTLVVCRTEVLHRGRTIANLDSSLYADGVLVAKANGSYAIFNR